MATKSRQESRTSVDIYEVNGVEFYIKEEAELYQQVYLQLLEQQYYVVMSGLDVTSEGTLYTDLLIIAKDITTAEGFIWEHLMTEYGTPIVKLENNLSEFQENYKILDKLKFKNIQELNDFYVEQNKYCLENQITMKLIKVLPDKTTERFLLDKEKIRERVAKVFS